MTFFSPFLFVRFLLLPAVSRSCSRAPSVTERRCSGHEVNILKTEICLCGTSGCNGVDEVDEKFYYATSKAAHTAGETNAFYFAASLAAKAILAVQRA